MATRRELRVSLPHRLFFLTIEPISALVGAYYAAFRPQEYLAMLGSTETLDPPTASILLSLANLVRFQTPQLMSQYALFAFNEAVILRSTSDRRVWRALIIGMLLADLGHLWSFKPLGAAWTDWSNPLVAGSIPFVIIGALMRLSFLSLSAR